MRRRVARRAARRAEAQRRLIPVVDGRLDALMVGPEQVARNARLFHERERLERLEAERALWERELAALREINERAIQAKVERLRRGEPLEPAIRLEDRYFGGGATGWAPRGGGVRAARPWSTSP